MVLTREKKEQKLSELKNDLQETHAIIFAQLSGLKMADQQEVKKQLAEKGIRFGVVKNSLLKIALKDKEIEFDQAILEKPLIVAFSPDEIEASKIIVKKNKESEILPVLGALIDGKFVQSDEIVALSKLPGRKQLQAMLVGTIKAPISNFVYVLKGNLSGLVSILKQVSEKQKS